MTQKDRIRNCKCCNRNITELKEDLGGYCRRCNEHILVWGRGLKSLSDSTVKMTIANLEDAVLKELEFFRLNHLSEKDEEEFGNLETSIQIKFKERLND